MDAFQLTCSKCGHNWEVASNATLAQGVATRCPSCGGDANAELGTVTHLPSQQIPTDTPEQPDIPGFELLAELNRGGMGVVFKARQIQLDRMVAIKFIMPDRVGSADMLKRFKREVQSAARLNHQSIVGVYATDLDAPLPYLVMEYVDGIDLHRLVYKVGPLDPLEAARYVKEAAHGLQHAYEAGLVHRDIKPANLMVTPSPLDTATATSRRRPRVKILDMGLARSTEDSGEASPSDLKTQAGEFLGTPDFIAPEQAEDPRNADIRSDLYSLGGTLYYLLTGQVPFQGATIVQKLRRQLTDPPPSPKLKRADVPDALDAIVRRLMAKDPAERFPTPSDLVEELDRLSRANSSLPNLPSSPVIQSTPSVSATPPITLSSGNRPSSQTLNLPARPTPTAAPTASLSGVQTQAVTLPTAVPAHTGGVLALAAGPGLLVTAGADKTLKVWNPDRLRDVRTISRGVGEVQQVAVIPNSRTCVTCAVWPNESDVGVQVWDVDAEAEVLRLRAPVSAIQSVGISPDGQRVAAGCPDGTVLVWPLAADGPPPVVSKGHHGAVTGMVFLPSSEELLTISTDGRVRHWELKTGVSKGASNANIGPLAAIAFGKRNRMAVAGDTIAARKRDGGYARFDGHAGRVRTLCYSPDGLLLFSGGDDGKIKVWKSDTGELVATLNEHAGPVTGMTPTAGGLAMFSVSADGALRRWRVPTVPGA